MLERAKRKIRVREIIGRATTLANNFWNKLRTGDTVDTTAPDFAFWDQFRRGLKKGYRFSGLFAKPITEINASWVMGSGPQAELVDGPDEKAGEDDPKVYTNTILSRFLTRIRGLLLSTLVDLYGLGEQYIVVNPDGSISIPSPDTVDYEYHRVDYRVPVKATITNEIDGMTITDEYRLDGRTIRIKVSKEETLAELRAEGWQQVDRNVVQMEFANLIGRLPVVQWANDRSGNERRGRPIYEGLLRLFERYDSVLENGLDAAEVMGHPIPTIEGLEDIEDFIERNGKSTGEQYQDGEGNVVQRVRIVFDRFATMLIGKGGVFRFVSPPVGFTKDLKDMAKWLFLLILDYTRIPEVIWGNEMSAGRSSSSESMKTFYSHIDGRRLAVEGEGADDILMMDAHGGLLEVIDIWLRYRQLIDRRVVVAPVKINWPSLNESSDEWNLKWGEAMHNRGLITDEEFVRQSGRIDDPDGEVTKAKDQTETNRDPMDKAVDDAFDKDDEEVPDGEAAA
jgi:hypothetical protein